MNLRSQIPNMLTMANLACGSVAVIHVSESSFYTPAIFLIFLAAIFDLLDGAVARALRVSGEMGKQLDSLADVISFGLAPSVVIYKLLEENLPMQFSWVKYFAIFNAVCAAYRLAKFNLSTDQTHDFRGLPSPANGIFWASILSIYAWAYTQQLPTAALQQMPTLVILILLLVTSLLMISNIRMFSFKFKSGGVMNNIYPVSFLIAIIAITLICSFIFHHFLLTIPLCIFTYMVMSIIYHVRKDYV